MQGTVELELERNECKDKTKDVYQSILETIGRLNSLIQPLIGYLKGSNEKYQFKIFNISKLISDIVTLRRPAATKNRSYWQWRHQTKQKRYTVISTIWGR